MHSPLVPTKRQKLRIVSLVPSWTATIVDLGMEDDLVGSTSFCTRPLRLRRKIPSIGGTKDADFQKIKELNPTHIVSCDEENSHQTLAQIENELTSCRLIRTLPKSPEDSIQDMDRLAQELSTPQSILDNLRARIERSRDDLRLMAARASRESYLYFIWKDPWMLAGNQTYISALLAEAHLENAVVTGSQLQERYPVLDTQVHPLSPHHWCFFSSEPFPFKSRHLEEFQRQHPDIQKSQCLKVNGQALSWYGSLLSEGYAELIRIRNLMEVAMR